MQKPVLTQPQRAFLAAARRAALATTAADGHARLVPICFVLDDREAPSETVAPLVAWSPLDEKPKSTADPRSLARVRDILARPGVTLLVDRWDEDWTRLGWLRCVGTARLVEPGELAAVEHRRIVAALRAKYPQYREHALEARPLLRIAIDRATGWGDLATPGASHEEQDEDSVDGR